MITPCHQYRRHLGLPLLPAAYRGKIIDRSDITSYCPPLMVNLHSPSLLQRAVRPNHIAHFQPATMCIILCSLHSVLHGVFATRRALKRFSILSSERKQILSCLAVLVSQAKKASDETYDEDARDTEIEGMLKLGGQAFSQVRRFLVVAV